MRSITEIDTEPRLKTLNGNCEAASGPTHFNFFFKPATYARNFTPI